MALIGAAPTAAAPARAQSGIAAASGQDVGDFYRARGDALLWLTVDAGDAAEQLLALLRSASLDALDPAPYDIEGLQRALDAVRSGRREGVKEADERLSAAFTSYVADLQQDPGLGITYVDPSLRPRSPTPQAALLTAASAPSLAEYVRTMRWMHPYYAGLRQGLADHRYSDDRQRDLLQLNLKRVRSLPAGGHRYILVNVAQQRLYMYDKRTPVDSMAVVVGKPKWPTPMLAAYNRYAALNPYWYVPSDLAGEDVGRFVIRQGPGYLGKMGYEVVSDWTADPAIIDPNTIDWKGVVDGKVQVMIRQKPGPHNFMGRMKFMFPNQFGVYLHDNPRRELFRKAARYFSGGCVRLEDAPRLGRWLFGRDLDWQSAATEQAVPLAHPVPVYISYLTAIPDGGSIAYFDDVYGRDAGAIESAVAQASAGGRRLQ